MGRSLITGGAGFIGSHLAEHLLELGEEVVVFDNLSTGRMVNIERMLDHQRFRFVEANVREQAPLEEEVRQTDDVYHLAAAVGVRLIVDDPVRTIETNIEGTSLILRLVDRYGKKVLLTSTSEVYGKSEHAPFREDQDTVYGPTSKSRWSYAFSKAIDEFLALAYADSRGLGVVVTRLFNTVGPRQVGQYGMVVPRFIDQALHEGVITVYGDGLQSRCFCHVNDVVPALVKLLHTPAARGQVVNLGSQEEVTMNELARRVARAVGRPCDITHIPYDKAYRPGFEDMRRRSPNLDRAFELIGYRPTFTLDQILADMIESIVRSPLTSFEDSDRRSRNH